MIDYAWWPHTTKPTVASYRLRCAQIIDEFQRRGFNAGLYSTGRVPKVLVLSKRYDPESIKEAKALRANHGTSIVLDLCDNHFFASDDDPRWQVRADHLRSAVAAADVVVASTQALASAIRQACFAIAEPIVIGDAAEAPFIPTFWQRWASPQTEMRLLNLKQKLKARPERRRLVWFGSHGSSYAEGGMSDLQGIYPMLEELNARTPLQLTIISNNIKKYRKTVSGWQIKTNYLMWNAATISRALSLHEVCVIPVGINPFTSCKSNNRIATALLHNLAVAADSIPAYEEFSSAVVLSDWESGLLGLLQDGAASGHRIGAGQEIVHRKWTLPVITDQWENALRPLLS